jgi:hypothetical protein
MHSRSVTLMFPATNTSSTLTPIQPLPWAHFCTANRGQLSRMCQGSNRIKAFNAANHALGASDDRVTAARRTFCNPPPGSTGTTCCACSAAGREVMQYGVPGYAFS